MDKHKSITTDTNGPIFDGEHRGATTVGSGAIARFIPPPAVMPVPTYELVTPGMATEWLRLNTNNRDQRPARINRLAQKLAAGRWTVTHQGVAIGADGTLYDGQHRLEAIAKSGVGVWMLVVRGLMPESRADIDSGEKRLTNDSLTIVDGVAVSNTDAAIANTLRFMLFNDGTGCRPCEVHEMRDLLTRFAPGIAAIHRAMPSSVRSITVAPVVAALVFAHAAAPEKVEAMAAQLHSGVGLEDRDPILGLRNGLIGAVAVNGSKKNDRRHAMTRSSHFKRTLLAIDARLSGRTLARVTSNATNLQDLKCFARFAKANGMEVKG